MVPPACGGETRTGLGMTRSATSPRPMRAPASRRIASSRVMNASVSVEIRGRLMAGLAEILGAQQDHRHRHVDAGDLEPFDSVAHLSRGQQAAGLGAGGIEETQADRGSGAGNAVDCGVALIGDRSAGRLNDGLDQLAGIDVVDADPRLGRAGGHQPGLDRKRPDAGQHVAAVGRGVDPAVAHAGLGEQIVDVRAGLGRTGRRWQSWRSEDGRRRCRRPAIRGRSP